MRDVAAARVARQKAYAAALDTEKTRILKQDKPPQEILKELVLMNQTSDNPNSSGMNLIKLPEVSKQTGPKKLSKRSKTITLMKDNPRRPGSDAWKRFNLYTTGMTVNEYLAAGGTSMDVWKDKKDGSIKVN